MIRTEKELFAMCLLARRVVFIACGNTFNIMLIGKKNQEAKPIYEFNNLFKCVKEYRQEQSKKINK